MISATAEFLYGMALTCWTPSRTIRAAELQRVATGEAMNIIHKTEAELTKRLIRHPGDGSTIDQVMTDLAVIVISNMRPSEIETAIIFSLGADGASELAHNLLGGSNV